MSQGKIGEEWLDVSEKGFLVRKFAFLLNYEIYIWATPFMGQWVDERLGFLQNTQG
jgi:hypothetical protein